jgi:hypothetical protein
VGSASNT